MLSDAIRHRIFIVVLLVSPASAASRQTDDRPVDRPTGRLDDKQRKDICSAWRRNSPKRLNYLPIFHRRTTALACWPPPPIPKDATSRFRV
uniref:Putative secreted protein n=1 Tax=Anopheles darlingi TaxID=43151 RepID=A0A2M4DBT6_ANODA